MEAGRQVQVAVCLSSAHAVREPWGGNVAVPLRRCGRPHPPPAAAEVFGAGPLPGAHAQVREGVRREAEGRTGDPTLRGSLLDPLQLRVRGTSDRPRAGHPGSHLSDPQCQRQECREWSRPRWQPLSGTLGGQAGRLGLPQCVVLTRPAAVSPELLTRARRREWAPVLWERLEQVLPQATVSWASTSHHRGLRPACPIVLPRSVEDGVSSCRGSWAGGGLLTCVYAVLPHSSFAGFPHRVCWETAPCACCCCPLSTLKPWTCSRHSSSREWGREEAARGLGRAGSGGHRSVFTPRCGARLLRFGALISRLLPQVLNAWSIGRENLGPGQERPYR